MDKRLPLQLFGVEEWVWRFESDRPMIKQVVMSYVILTKSFKLSVMSFP